MANSRLEGGRERRSEMASQKHLFDATPNEVQRSQVEPIFLGRILEGLPVGSLFAARCVGR